MNTSQKRKLGCIIPVTIVVILVILIYVAPAFLPSNAERLLPPAASNVQTHYSGVSDYVSVIKADLSEDDFHQYAKDLEFRDTFDPEVHNDIQSTIDMSFQLPSWWDPPKASRTTYFKFTRGDDHLKLLKYNDGKVYYLSSSW